MRSSFKIRTDNLKKLGIRLEGLVSYESVSSNTKLSGGIIELFRHCKITPNVYDFMNNLMVLDCNYSDDDLKCMYDILSCNNEYICLCNIVSILVPHLNGYFESAVPIRVRFIHNGEYVVTLPSDVTT